MSMASRVQHLASRLLLIGGLLVLLLSASSQSWSLGHKWGDQDYFQFWAVGRLAGTGVTDIYSTEARHELGPQFQAEAAAHTSVNAIKVSRRWTVLETYGTPFLYTIFGRLSTGDYDVDSSVWQALSLICLVAATLAIGRVVGLSWLVSLAAAAVVVATSQPFFSDVRTGNVTELQVGLVALFIVLRARWRTSRGDILAGIALGLAIAFKPNLALVAVLLIALWFIDRRPRVLVRQVGGMAAGGAIAVLIGAVAWQSFEPWIGWLTSVGELGGQVAYSVTDGNYALARLGIDAGLPDLSRGLFVGFVALTVGAMIFAAWRRRSDAAAGSPELDGAPGARSDADAFERECLALSAGVAIVLLASPLSWLYYYLLLVPAQLCLLGRIGRVATPGKAIRVALVGLSFALLWFTPVEAIIGPAQSAVTSAVQSIAAAAVLLGLTLYELAWGTTVPRMQLSRWAPTPQRLAALGAASAALLARSPGRGTGDPRQVRRGLSRGFASIRSLVVRRPLLEAGDDVPLGGTGKLAIVLLVAVPMVMTAIWLLPELTIPVPNLNDDAFQYLLIQRMNDALATGRNVLDFWVPQLELGFPQAFYYQHFPHLVVVLLDRLSLGAVDLFTLFNGVRWVLLVALPLTVYWSMRRMGFSMVASAIAAAASPLISGAFRYGFEYDSYIWRGWGMFTQLWAMHLSFIAFACVYRVINRGTGYILAIAALSVLLLSHLIYAYMMAITVIVVVVVGARRSTIVPRLVRLGIVGAVVLAITAYQWLPFITTRQYLSASPYLEPYKFDSFGAPAILGWLSSGDLIDHGRLPVLTALLVLGIVAAVIRRTKLNIFVLAGFLFWLVLYFGRPTLGPLFDFFPLSDGLLIHRFIGEMELFAIPLIGLGGALVWGLVNRLTAARQSWINESWRPLVAAGVLIVILAPALGERIGFYAANSDHMLTANTAVETDAGLAAIITKLKAFPEGGRVYAGLREDWGKQLALGSLNVRDVLTFNQISVAGPPYQGLSLNSSLIWWFRDQVPSQFDLFDARYVLTPAGLAVPDFYRLVQRSGKYALYSVATTGAVEYVAIDSRQRAATQDDLFFANVDWFRSDQPAAGNFIHWDYFSPTGPADTSAGCPDGKTLFESDKADAITVVVDCSVAANLVLKVSYHPNWTVTVDGQPVTTFQASPSFVGIHLPAGRHQVEAVYQATPSKVPLLIVGLGLLLVAVLSRRRLDWLPTRLGAMRIRRRPTSDGDAPVPTS